MTKTNKYKDDYIGQCKIGDYIGQCMRDDYIGQCIWDKAQTISDISTSSSSTSSSETPSSSSVTEYKFQSARTDKRVSLNCAPLQKNANITEYIERLKYVLGEESCSLSTGETVYGFLFNTLSKSCGLIFPYTPQIQFQYEVQYESVDVTHSNLSYNFYKNSPPPSITLDATFTADTRENALHMLSAIWFLRAVTKCDFGELAYKGEDKTKNNVPGMPPPILYLNGYNSLMDNIPVVITSFSYALPKDKHYVPLGINLDSNVQAFNDKKLYSDVATGNFYDNFDGNATGAEGMKYLNGIANTIKSLQESATIIESNRYNNFYFNNWLPTELTFNIQLKIQPNLLKHKKQFNLNWFKMGLYNLDEYKDSLALYLTGNNKVSNISNIEDAEIIKYISNLTGELYDTKEEAHQAGLENEDMILGSKVREKKEELKTKINDYKEAKKNKEFIKQVSLPFAIYNQTKNKDLWENIEKDAVWELYLNPEKSIYGYTEIKTKVTGQEIVNELQKNMKQKDYKFDKSGWTW